VDPKGDHDGCMEAFSLAGIYLFVDLDTFTTQIEETVPEWTMSQYANFTQVIDTFAKYDNLAGFFIGNEVFSNCCLDRMLMRRDRSLRIPME
jgi:1,3-beta-glucanosyltransferase GAS1